MLFDNLAAESGKLITWGSADDQGQSYLTSGKHGVCGKSFLYGLIYIVSFELILLSSFITTFIKEAPEPFPLPTEDPIMKAAAGWAHCVSVTGNLLSPSLSGLSAIYSANSECYLAETSIFFSYFYLKYYERQQRYMVMRYISVQKRMMCTHGAGRNVCLLPRLLQISLLEGVLKGMLFGKNQGQLTKVMEV